MGIFEGILGYVLIAALALGVVSVLVLAIVSAAKNGKKENDADEDEFTALAEYDGVEVNGEKFSAPKKSDAEPASAAVTEVFSQEEKSAPEAAEEAPAQVEPAQSQPQTPPPETAPVVTPVSQPATTPVAASAKEAAPAKFEFSAENPISEESVPVDQRQGDWSNYDGVYDGYYYDPFDAMYYEGKPPVYVQKAYLPPAPAPIIRRIANPAAPMMNKARSQRGSVPKSNKGFDLASIYGQYVVEHDGEEYFFTLYNNKDDVLFESFNYSNEQFCKDAVKRFKKHVLAGSFSVENVDGKFRFVLVRKLNTYYGPDKDTRVEAEASIENLKSFAQTSITQSV